MRNVTITLDEDTAKWARVWAAEHDTSVSRMLGELLREKMEREDAYWKAYREWKTLKPLALGGGPYSKREEIYASRDVNVRRQQRAALRPRPE
jgi:hypothetical protein